jgi:hypothetical protein
MDVEVIIDRVAEHGQQKALPVLVTSFGEIIETCRAAGRDDLVARLNEGDGHHVAARAARKLGDMLMEGADYWEGIPVAVERVMGG